MHDSFKALCQKHGLDEAKAAELHQHGLTAEMATNAANKGLSFADILVLIKQYGPSAIAIIQDILGKIQKPPAPA